VAGGGRYDGLPGSFGESLPAVGFSFSLDRLEQIVTDALDAPDSSAAAVDVRQGFEKVMQLRQAGKAVKLCL
jgi:histidyl-tRNA synthetase